MNRKDGNYESKEKKRKRKKKSGHYEIRKDIRKVK